MKLKDEASKPQPHQDPNIEEFYQHFEASKGRFIGCMPVISCTMMEKKTGKTARGVAICSEADGPKWSVWEGQFIARNKALRALKGRGNEPIMRKEAISVLLTTPCPFTMGSEANPDLTFQERYRLYGFKNINKERRTTVDFEVKGLKNRSLPTLSKYYLSDGPCGKDLNLFFHGLDIIGAKRLLAFFRPNT